MAYLALARKWRPRSFSEVVGQTHVVKALSNALDSDRVHHAYLFTGTRGVGKTTLARIFAKSLNCETGTSAEPCQQCSTCLSVDEGRFVDLIEVDAASRTKVDDTRELLENVQYAPTAGKYKVYLIDEVHMLSGHSFNALLKTLEEPPEHVKFLFATTDPQKMPVTVLSRCLQFNLRAMRPEQIENQLIKILDQENIEYELPAVQALAKAADGSMRDGLSLLDQSIAQSPTGIQMADVSGMLGTIKAEHSAALLQALASANAEKIMQVVADMADHAVDFEAAFDELLVQLYNISLTQVAPAASSAKGLEETTSYEIAKLLSPEATQLYYQIGLHGKRDLALAPSSRVGFEMALLRMLVFAPGAENQNSTATATATAPTPATMPTQQNVTPSLSEPATATSAPANQQGSAPVPPSIAHQSQGAVHRPEEYRQAPDVERPVPAVPSRPAPSSSGSVPPDHSPANAARPTESPPQASASCSIAHALAGQNEWGELVEQTNLQGLTRQLAMNCASERMNDDRIDLVLAPRLQHLNKPERVEEIVAEINRLSGQSYVVTIEVEDSDKETPAECLVRLGHEQKSQLKADIEQEPGVKALMSEFNATIVEQSIKPAGAVSADNKTGDV